MPSAVLDSVVLVSALLTPGGVTSEIIRQARDRAFTCYLSDEILAETPRVLAETPRLRQRYAYTDEEIQAFILSLAQWANDVPVATESVRLAQRAQ
jgi:putative PIN family toxin of toxin-antitoxin system